MKKIEVTPSLADQVYETIVEEICEARLLPGTHLVQEQLAERLNVSRQPIQQALALLKADGLIVEVGKRGMQVAGLDLTTMRHHYHIRAALDGLAISESAKRAASGPGIAAAMERRGERILVAGRKAIGTDGYREQIRHDESFHSLFYEFSGNPFLVRTAAPHWRFLRRVMGEVLRHAEPPLEIWQQHAEMLEAAVSGDHKQSEHLAKEHVHLAETTLQQAIEARGSVILQAMQP